MVGRRRGVASKSSSHFSLQRWLTNRTSNSSLRSSNAVKDSGVDRASCVNGERVSASVMNGEFADARHDCSEEEGDELEPKRGLIVASSENAFVSNAVVRDTDAMGEDSCAEPGAGTVMSSRSVKKFVPLKREIS